MSRLQNGQETDADYQMDYKQLPKGLVVIQKTEGGGNSLFESLWICLKAVRECNDSEDYPEDCKEMRQILVKKLLDNCKRYNLSLNKHQRKQYKLMYNDGKLPCAEIILMACNVFNLEIYVHHGMKYPVLYKIKGNENDMQIIHLQCISMIRYNPLCSTKNVDYFVGMARERFMTYCDISEEQSVSNIVRLT